MDDGVRWLLKVSRDTDQAMRAYLARAKNGDLSTFVQEAVRAKLKEQKRPKRSRIALSRERTRLAKALEQIRARTRALPKARFEKIVEQAQAYARRRR